MSKITLNNIMSSIIDAIAIITLCALWLPSQTPLGATESAIIGVFVAVIVIRYTFVRFVGGLVKLLCCGAWAGLVLSFLYKNQNLKETFAPGTDYFWAVFVGVFVFALFIHMADIFASHNKSNSSSKRRARREYDDEDDYDEDEYDEDDEYDDEYEYDEQYDEYDEEYEDEYAEYEQYDEEYEDEYIEYGDDEYDDEYEEYEEDEYAEYDEDEYEEGPNKKFRNAFDRLFRNRYVEEEADPQPEKDVYVESDVVSRLFIGCNDKETLTSRYRSLMKTFHPDTGSGDVEMSQAIQSKYKELLKKFQ